MLLLPLTFACTQVKNEQVTEEITVAADTANDPDYDGFTDDDCGSTNPAINPDAADVAGDGIDQNCDGVDGIDADADTFASASSGGDDCDDANAAINPGANDSEANGVDEDCDDNDGPDLPQHAGDITLGSDEDVAWFCANYSGNRGSLTVNELSDGNGLSCLHSVSGNLSIITTATAITFANLGSVGGSLYIQDDGHLVTYDFPVLENTGGEVSFGASATPVWHSVSMPLATSLGGFYAIAATAGSTFDFSALTTVSGSFSVWDGCYDVLEGTGAPSTVTAPLLIEVGGYLGWGDYSYSADCPLIADFSGVTSVGGLQTDISTDTELPNLVNVTNDVYMYGPATISLPNVPTVQYIQGYSYGGLLMPSLASAVYISLFYVSALDFSSLTAADGVSLYFTGLTDMSSFSSLSSAGTLDVEYNTVLENIDGLDNLTSLDGMYAYYNSPVTDADFQDLADRLESLGYYGIYGNGPTE